MLTWTDSSSPGLGLEAGRHVSGGRLFVELDRHGNLGVQRRVNPDDPFRQLADLEAEPAAEPTVGRFWYWMELSFLSGRF